MTTALPKTNTRDMSHQALRVDQIIDSNEVAVNTTDLTQLAGKTAVTTALTTSSASTGTVTPVSETHTQTGIGASVDGVVSEVKTEVALGTYANANNSKLNFGTAGRVTGLGGAHCAELDLGPGTTQGSYACYEAELVAPANSVTGSRTSFATYNLSGAGAAAVDTAGNLFDLNGVTSNTDKLFRSGLTQAVTASACLRIKVNGTNYYIPLCAAQALTS